MNKIVASNHVNLNKSEESSITVNVNNVNSMVKANGVLLKGLLSLVDAQSGLAEENDKEYAGLKEGFKGKLNYLIKPSEDLAENELEKEYGELITLMNAYLKKVLATVESKNLMIELFQMINETTNTDTVGT